MYEGYVFTKPKLTGGKKGVCEEIPGTPGTPPQIPHAAQLFRFRIHFHRKAPTSEVHTPPPKWVHALRGNPGSATATSVHGQVWAT